MVEAQALFSLLDHVDEVLRIQDLRLIYKYIFFYKHMFGSKFDIKVKAIEDNKYQVILILPDGSKSTKYLTPAGKYDF